jgi:hypothetical protein
VPAAAVILFDFCVSFSVIFRFLFLPHLLW